MNVKVLSSTYFCVVGRHVTRKKLSRYRHAGNKGEYIAHTHFYLETRLQNMFEDDNLNASSTILFSGGRRGANGVTLRMPVQSVCHLLSGSWYALVM
jgi:hypothetical protein